MKIIVQNKSSESSPIIIDICEHKRSNENDKPLSIPEMAQQIVNELVKVLPQKWEKVRLYSQITKSSYEYFFYVYVNGKYIQCYSDEMKSKYKINDYDLQKVFDKLYEIMLPDQLDKKWYVATLLLDKSGKVSIEYEYKNYKESILEYKKIWKDKYLK